MKTRALLDALSNRRAFVLYRLIPRADGKTDKVPTCPLTGANIDAQNPANWISGDEALLWANTLPVPPGALSFGVGLVISEGSGLWCLDLDNCRAGDGWQPHVANFVARFPGAYVEVSVSGTGVHILGTTTAPPVHGTRNKTYRAELYTKLRFIAVTGEGASGNILSDCTTQLTQFAAQFFPPHGDVEHGVEWTDKPVPEWRGPSDDVVLIGRALRSASASAVFNGRASFADLYYANGDALVRSFPSQNSHSPWDGSAADQALANHLAFWTGNDCERMLRLMRTSRLVRPKWDRTDYMRSTILRACGDQREWYKEREQQPVTELSVAVPQTPAPGVPPPPEAVPASAMLAAGERPPPGTKVLLHQQKQMFAGMCWVEDIRKIQQPDGYALGKEQFDIAFGGRQYLITPDGQRPSSSAWEAFTSNEAYDFPQVNTQCFDPSQPTGTIRVREGRREINSYKPAQIRRVAHTAETIAPFLQFVRTLLPHGDDALILLSYMSASTRFLGAKFAWCPFVQGVKGNGKTTLARIAEYCISQRYTHWAKSSELHEKFNNVFVEKLLVIVDETRTQDQTELQEVLKLYVTSKRIEVRPMYAEKLMKDVCFNMFLLSNHQNGVRIDKDERRFAPLYCAQQEKSDLLRDKLTADYFIDFNHWLDADGFALIYDYLLAFDIPTQYNPAGACTTAPITTSTEQALVASLGGVEQEILSAVEQKREGFRGGWINSVSLDHLLAQLGKDKVVPRQSRNAMVLGLGYVAHPSLPNGGLCDVGMPDGTMPRLYVTKGHAWAVDYLNPAQVRDGYFAAQRG